MKKVLYILKHNPWGIGGGCYASNLYFTAFLEVLRNTNLIFSCVIIAHKVSARGYSDFIEKGYMLSLESKEEFADALRTMINRIDSKPGIYQRYSFLLC